MRTSPTGTQRRRMTAENKIRIFPKMVVSSTDTKENASRIAGDSRQLSREGTAPSYVAFQVAGRMTVEGTKDRGLDGGLEESAIVMTKRNRVPSTCGS